MRPKYTRPLQRRSPALLIVIFLALGGCASEPAKDPTPAPPPTVEKPEPVVPVQTNLSLPPSKYTAQFLQADRLLNQNNWMAASEVVARISTAQASATDRVYLSYLQARIEYIRGNVSEALALLDALDYPGMNNGQKYRILNFRRYILQMSGDYLESARLGDAILRLAPNTDTAALKRSIWRDVQRVSTPQLQEAAGAAVDPQWQDWLELSLLTRAPLAAQRQSLPLWIQNNPQHPSLYPRPCLPVSTSRPQRR